MTPALVSRVLEDGLQNGWSPKTYNNYREVVHRAFSHAIRERGLVSPGFVSTFAWSPSRPSRTTASSFPPRRRLRSSS